MTKERVIAALQSNNPDVLQQALSNISDLCSDDREEALREIARRMDSTRFFIALSRAVVLRYLWEELA